MRGGDNGLNYNFHRNRRFFLNPSPVSGEPSLPGSLTASFQAVIGETVTAAGDSPKAGRETREAPVLLCDFYWIFFFSCGIMLRHFYYNSEVTQ